MRRRLCIALAALLALGGSALAAAITPDADTTPMKPVGAQDRARNGPAALATPPADIGDAPDPDEPTSASENEAAPAPQ